MDSPISRTAAVGRGCGNGSASIPWLCALALIAVSGAVPGHATELTPQQLVELARASVAVSNDLDGADDDGFSLLQRAAMVGATNVAELLLRNGATADHMGVAGRSPLHFAAAGGHDGLALMLISEGAHATLRSFPGGRTPAEEAAKAGHQGLAVTLEAFSAGQPPVTAWEDPAGDTLMVGRRPRGPNARVLDITSVRAWAQDGELRVRFVFTEDLSRFWSRPDEKGVYRNEPFATLSLDTDFNGSTGGNLFGRDREVGFDSELKIDASVAVKMKDGSTRSGLMAARARDVARVLEPVFVVNAYQVEQGNHTLVGDPEMLVGPDATGGGSVTYNGNWVEFRFGLDALDITARRAIRVNWTETFQEGAGPKSFAHTQDVVVAR